MRTVTKGTSVSHTWRHNCAIFGALLRRDLKVLKGKFFGCIIDGFIILGLQVLTFGYLFPLLDLPREQIAPLYLGMSVIALNFFQGYSFSTLIMHMLPQNGPSMFEYHLILPLPKRWLFAEYVLSFMIEAFLVTLPLITIGFLVLHDAFATMQGSFMLFFSVYLLALLFLGLLFLLLPIHYDPQWFWGNIWPRRLSPLFNISAIFFTWKSVYAFSPVMAGLFLCNPFTYFAEGLRVALLGGDDYLSVPLCVGMLLFACLCCVFMLKNGIKKRLDPV